MPPEPTRIDVAIDPTAPRGNVLAPLARLLLALAQRDRRPPPAPRPAPTPPVSPRLRSEK